MKSLRQLGAGFLTALAPILVLILPISLQAQETAASIMTDYLPTINETIDSGGFIHPGVGLTRDLLENIRTKIRAEAEPWTNYFENSVLQSYTASIAVTSSNQDGSDPTKPASDAFNSQGFNGRFISDGLKAYTQALLYYISGNEVYRENALHIIRIWSQMDPEKYEVFTDSHIHTGVPLKRMVMAAEILRYTSYQDENLAWTDADTIDFTNNLVVPVTETFCHNQNHFMNQHNYPIIGAMAGYIFTGNRGRFHEAVEWFSVNKTANDQGFNGSVKQLFRWVTEEQEPDTYIGQGTLLAEPYVQHMEMGRDQAHGGGDITNAALITRMLHAQGTKLDPVDGTPSTAYDAVDPMEFLNDRLIAAADYFWTFMLGYDTRWTPQAYAISSDGYIRDTYRYISDSYKGRFLTANFWDFYTYYTYEKNKNVENIAPHYYEAFTKKLNPDKEGWENKDAGNDFWLYLPPEAEYDAADFLAEGKTANPIFEVEERYTNITKRDADGPVAYGNIDTTAVIAKNDGSSSFIRFFLKETGTRIVYLSSRIYNTVTAEIRVRSTGPAVLEAMGTSVALPDTNGEWVYIPVTGKIGDFCTITISGLSGTRVDIDHIDVSETLTPPIFNTSDSEITLNTYAGASVSVDFSASDAGSSDSIRYALQNSPAGAVIASGTGAFSWNPLAENVYTFLVTAYDGTVITAKRVTATVYGDRASAVEATASAYDSNEIYESPSLDSYQTAYNSAVSQIDTASDEAFDSLLRELQVAADGLRPASPLTEDGTLDWSDIANWSSWGDAAGYMDDGNVKTGGNYGLALGTAPYNLHHIVDFGPDYKVSAVKLGFQSNIFSDRLANSTVYGSNDGDNWDRLTPGVTQFTQDYQTLEVASAYQNEQYRYIKIQMIEPLPDVLYSKVRNLMEFQEFQIYGTRHETDNKIQSISMSSDQSLGGRIVLGDTVNISVTAKEPIQNLEVVVQGQNAAVTTEDSIHWLGTATLTNSDQAGNVKIAVNYRKQDGTDGEPLYSTTDSSSLYVADSSDIIDDLADITELIDSTDRTPSETLTQVNYLFDNDPSTNSDFRVNGSGAGSYIMFDFHEGNQVSLSSIEILARQDQYYTRLAGAIAQGSNDGEIWTDLTDSAISSLDWQLLEADTSESYRYVRIFNSKTWFGNMAELRFHGTIERISKLESVSIGSAQSLKNRIVLGDTARLNFTSTEAIRNVHVTIQGTEAAVHSSNGRNWTADALLGAGTQLGSIGFRITYDRSNGAEGFPITTTTDGSSLIVADDSDIIDVIGLSNLIDSTASSGRGEAETLNQTSYLFDADPATNSDYRLNGSGSGSFITFDFREGNQVVLHSVEILARQDQYYTRLDGAVVQGSNDGDTWTNLTAPAVSSSDWQVFDTAGSGVYRYIRVFNASSWFGNMAELRFHGIANIDTTPPEAPRFTPSTIASTNSAVTLAIGYPEDPWSRSPRFFIICMI